jgi:DNA-binding response OmpR family regulator
MLTSEVLGEQGYQVVSIYNGDLIWEQIENTQPELVLLHSHSDAFDTMNLYFNIKQKYADLAVIIYKTDGFDAIDRIKAAIADVLSEKWDP